MNMHWSALLPLGHYRRSLFIIIIIIIHDHRFGIPSHPFLMWLRNYFRAFKEKKKFYYKKKNKHYTVSSNIILLSLKLSS